MEFVFCVQESVKRLKTRQVKIGFRYVLFIQMTIFCIRCQKFLGAFFCRCKSDCSLTYNVLRLGCMNNQTFGDGTMGSLEMIAGARAGPIWRLLWVSQCIIVCVVIVFLCILMGYRNQSVTCAAFKVV